MAPRMVYCSMICLLWSFFCRSEYDVSVRQLRTLFTYWCHVCCLRFRQNLRQYTKTSVRLVNILFMAPRMVYCSMICLLWSFFCRSEYDVSVRQLRTDLVHVLVSRVLPQISAKSEATHVTPVREQSPYLTDQNVVLASTKKLQSKQIIYYNICEVGNEHRWKILYQDTCHIHCKMYLQCCRSTYLPSPSRQLGQVHAILRSLLDGMPSSVP